MIILDASVLIGFMFAQDPHHKAARELLRHLSGDELGASPITLAEALVLPARDGALAAAEQMLTALEVHEVPLGPRASPRLAQLRAETGLKLPDCCVLLAAADAGAGVATFDGRLAAAARQRGHAVLPN